MNEFKNTSSTETGQGLLTNVKSMANDIMAHNVQYYDEYRYKDNETVSEETMGRRCNKILKNEQKANAAEKQ